MYRYLVHSILLVVCAFWWNGEARGQYFGRNKPQYHSFDFEVLQTPHFEIYHYTNDSTIRYMAELSERWYSIYQKVFSDTIQFKNPIIFYNNHADFQQTTAVNSLIGTGTGGVTEALKNRVVMPIMGTWAQTDHVIGHELVHAFQYNMLREADSLSLQNIQYLPLWMVEGMAEYLSIGRLDSHTAMWMRDAVFYDDIPSIKDLNSDPKYFPYRYGHSFWAFIGSNWGDSTVIKLFKNTASYGLKVAVDSVLGINTKELSNMWKTALIDHYKPWFKDSVEIIKGKKLLDKKNAGSMNLSPELSSDGNYLVFYSERDVFTIDLYLADARSGHIIRKLNSYSKIDHIDALNFIESSGTWSPDNRFFAYVVFSKGQNTIVVLNVGKNEIIKEIDIPGVPSISNPVWSPVEDQLVFTGLVNGQNDLFLYDMESKKVQQLTDDWYSDIQPAWSPDGEKLAFVTDRLGWQNEQKGRFNLAVLKLSDRSVENIEVFTKADNLNPIFKDSENILFLSNRDGFRNLYSYNLNTGKVFQHTDYYIGISGITSLSPAISYSSQSGQLAYSYYQKNGYNIYSAPIDSLPGKSVLKDSVNFTAATLPEFTANKSLIIQPYIDTLHVHRPLNRDSVKKLPYKPKFKLDYIGGASMGVSVSRYGTGLMGGVNTMFSDILGTNQLFAAIALNGEIYDFGSQFAYFNQKKRTSWGVVLSHIPYKTGWLGHSRDSLALKDTTIVVDNFTIDILRTFENQFSLLTFFPFSQTRRVEVSGSMAHYGFRLERFNNYYYEGFKID
ncbi:MAG: tolB protein precursor, partial [Cyclobacteriaceae bacterium]|nr:tolB protein precursor [Cyclobacteriaceae bacterium]